MDENKIVAAILTFALWNNKEKERQGADDLSGLVSDYKRIFSELGAGGE